MFDFAWSEIALVGVVALIAIGPKDMPVAIKTVTDMVKKARRMAGEFQGHVDEMVKDTSLSDVRNQINELRSLNIKSRILAAVDGDGTISRAVSEDPFRMPPPAAPSPDPFTSIDPAPPAAAPVPIATMSDAPAFIPPGDALPPPAFIPPDAARPAYA